jgi:hypothetical protein
MLSTGVDTGHAFGACVSKHAQPPSGFIYLSVKQVAGLVSTSVKQFESNFINQCNENVLNLSSIKLLRQHTNHHQQLIHFSARKVWQTNPLKVKVLS